jgi:ParB-like chromosome segregation protein Spo0J
MATNENPALAGGVSEDGQAATLIVSEDTPTTSLVQADARAFHPLADIFPLLEGDEFEALVADIKANGLHEPIILLDDLILDGRNRYRACIAAGVEPSWRPFQGDDPAAYVVSMNVARRHLTAEQKRELVAKLLKAKPEKSNRQIATVTRADHKTVGSIRSDMEGRGEIPHVETRTDTKGRKQPAAKSKRESEAQLISAIKLNPERLAAAQPQEDVEEEGREDETTAWEREGLLQHTQDVTGLYAKEFCKSEVENNAELAAAARKAADAWGLIADALGDEDDEDGAYYEGTIKRLVARQKRFVRITKKAGEDTEEFQRKQQPAVDNLAARLVALDPKVARGVFEALSIRGPCGGPEGVNFFLADPFMMAIWKALPAEQSACATQTTEGEVSS